MPNSAPKNFAQHISTAFVRRLYPIRDQKRSCPRMVRDDPQARRTLRIRNRCRCRWHRRKPGQLRRPANQRHNQVRVVVRHHALQHARNPLQPHPCVDARLRQGRQHASASRRIKSSVELHKHQVPDLHVALVILRKRLVLARLARCQPQVEEDLGARPTRPRVPHLPEVVLHAHREDTLARHPRLHPKLLRLGIPRHRAFPFEDRHIQPRRIDPKPVRRGQQLPRKGDRLPLEVIPKAEVPEHLKKRMVPPRKAHVLKIVMLASRTHTLLRARRPRVRPLLRAQKDILELVHPRIRKQQRRIIGRHQRRRVHAPMPFALEKTQKIFPNLAARAIVHRAKV